MRKTVSTVLVVVLAFGSLGCATSYHGVEITNVSAVREIYIRNAGTTNWSSNLVSSLKDIDRSIFFGEKVDIGLIMSLKGIDKSRFSDTVDIRVVDANGIVYSKYNVPFGNDAFEQRYKERYWGVGTIVGYGGVALLILTIVILIRGG